MLSDFLIELKLQRLNSGGTPALSHGRRNLLEMECKKSRIMLYSFHQFVTRKKTFFSSALTYVIECKRHLEAILSMVV